MENPICISTGCLSRLFKDRNDIIKKLQRFSPSGIELSFHNPEYLLNFDIERDILEYLQTLRFNSIHAPFKEIVYGNNKLCKEVLRKISELYTKINARNVVFHKDQIEDYNLITDSKFVSSIENDDWRKPNNSIRDIKNLLNKHKELKLTFDFAHAITVSPSEIPEYLDYFKDRLAEIHISIINKESKRHDFLHKHNNEKLKSLTQFLKIASVPLILECVVFNPKEIDLIEKEIEYIKRI